MNIKEIIQEHYPGTSQLGLTDYVYIAKIKFSKLLDDRFIYVEFYDGEGVFYEMKQDKLYSYKRHEIIGTSDNKKFTQIFREAKLNELLNEE